MKKKSRSLTVYFASELYSLKHLIGNAYLAEAIYEKSHGRYLCDLPQDLEPRGSRPHPIRDQAIRSLISSDLALFLFDGPDIDSATAIEFMYAKFADIPSVILRSDLRAGGDGPESWSLMASYYPRTLTIVLDSLASYKAIIKRRQRTMDEIIRLAGQHVRPERSECATKWPGPACGLSSGCATRAGHARYLREEIFNWLPLMPGLSGKEKALRKEFEHYLEVKVEKGLL